MRDSFRGRISTRELEDLQVIVSELTTNALRHGDGEIHLHAVLKDGLVHGEVVDDGHGFERAVDAHGIDALGGRGLSIVSGLARRWGIHEGSSHVWFVLAPDAKVAPVAPRLGAGERPEALDG